MLDLHHPETQFLLDALRQASIIIQQVQAELVTTVLTKDDRSPVTVADYACQALVAERLSRAFPADLLVAEENAKALRDPAGSVVLERVTYFLKGFLPAVTANQACDWIDYGRAQPGGIRPPVRNTANLRLAVQPGERFWTLDPLDGTKGFLRGDQYVVALALVEGGRVQLGGLGCPKLNPACEPAMDGSGSLVIARRDQGAWIAPLNAPDNFTRLQVSDCRQAEQARLLRSVESGHTDVSKVDQFVEAMGIAAPPLPMDSQAKYVLLAGGRGELVVRLLTPTKPDYREKIWDQAAGSLIVAEAGGCISDLDGKELDFRTGRTLANNRGILASNGYLHAAALQALGRVAA